jgi:hypothetical protein
MLHLGLHRRASFVTTNTSVLTENACDQALRRELSFLDGVLAIRRAELDAECPATADSGVT